MNLDLYTIKILSAVLVLIVAVLAGIFPFKVRSRNVSFALPQAEAFAAGVFLGVGLMHMLADAAMDFQNNGVHYPIAFLLAGTTFLLLLFLEHLAVELHKTHDSQITIMLLAVIMLSIHSFFAGTALGVSTNVGQVIIVLAAILAHKWAASFSLSVNINKTSFSFNSRMCLFLFFTLMTPLGILIGTDLVYRHIQNPLIEPVFNSLAAGTFIYIGTLHGLKRSVMIERCCNLQESIWLIAGFALMALVAVWV